VIVRETNDDTALPITQENHAELLAQFATHWGNQKFSKLEPYDSMVFATLHHDSGYREVYDVRARHTLLVFPITR
jgi:hypothetical protein